MLHPMYTAMFLQALAFPFLIPNLVAGYAMLFACLVFFPVRIWREEKMMVGAFGEEYEEYRKRTARLIPFTI
jgi:protein-S-isoprenylcysteine O-methyltransferase Ste14